ncbi:MAG: hypothetical protein M2R45_01037 [Verrucomicrobia subdivision 3 bacterium]|nr:hypothetical protein [Limisphaerales bacterium]MCS1414149.1 hypothetical protein [Limisphaerales bacterium]
MTHATSLVDMQSAWLHLDAATLTKQLGEERMRQFQPMRQLLGASMCVDRGEGAITYRSLDRFVRSIHTTHF